MTRAPHRHEELLIAEAARLLAAALAELGAPVPEALVAGACRRAIPAVLDRASEIGAVRQGVKVYGVVTEEVRED